MKKYIIGIAVLFTFAGFCLQDNDMVFQQLYSLEGTWKMNGKRGPMFEEWTKVDNNHLQSRSFFVRNTDTIVTERVKLTNTKAGIFYTPVVEDQNQKQPIPFKFTGLENKSFVFANPEHDFPKRIVYTFITTDSLHAFVDDGTDTGKRLNFHFKRQ